MNRTFLLLFLSAALFGLMGLMPEGEKKRHVANSDSEETIVEVREEMVYEPLKIYVPAAGEPSDNGLTQNMHREFRDALNRDPISAIELAREHVFTDELDAAFRLEILRELKAIQFSQPGVLLLADEVIDNPPTIELFEEALTIRYASMDSEDFSKYVMDISARKDSPEYQAILRNYQDAQFAEPI